MVVELQIVDMEPAVDKLEALVISAFFLLLLLDPSWNTNFMLIILSIRFLFLSVLLIQTQKVVFALDSFGAKYKKKNK